MKPASFPFLFLSLLMLSGCDRDTCCDDPAEETSFEAPAPLEFTDIQENARNTSRQEIQFNAEEGITFTSDNGTVLQIAPGCLSVGAGEPVSGNVTLQFTELYNHGDMLASGKPTTGLTATEERAFLVSGGIFYINIIQNEQQITNNCGTQLQVPVSLTGGPDQDMILWNGMEDDNGIFIWQPDPQGELFVENDRYVTFFSGGPGWVGIARPRDFAEPKTGLRVLVTEGYNAENASVYIAYSGEKHGLAQLPAFDAETNVFSDPFRQIPRDREVHLIFVSADSGLWRYAIKNVTTGKNQVYTIAYSETTTATLEELLSVIGELP
ncbi:hypothetical protein LS482_14665 [Sinomicrobium kalidii]|uniref:hypothetical protein n=1 Tax=Sinomicrobium kalidii TaxID=2900738 RepID=UPI001E4445E8|nr:hypothetical protein [Sinomicrobium kalidii]UGU14931.1 hypothetical protein LS482_14665 [Sinomicrobium kalidii]